MTVVVLALEKKVLLQEMDAFKRRKRKKMEQSSKVLFLLLKGSNKPVKLFNMPLLKLASVLMLHRCKKTFLLNSVAGLCVLNRVATVNLSWKFKIMKKQVFCGIDLHFLLLYSAFIL